MQTCCALFSRYEGKNGTAMELFTLTREREREGERKRESGPTFHIETAHLIKWLLHIPVSSHFNFNKQKSKKLYRELRVADCISPQDSKQNLTVQHWKTLFTPKPHTKTHTHTHAGLEQRYFAERRLSCPPRLPQLTCDKLQCCYLLSVSRACRQRGNAASELCGPSTNDSARVPRGLVADQRLGRHEPIADRNGEGA